MEIERFDMQELEDAREFDASAAVKNFNGKEEYFNALYRFMQEAHNYLQSYNPTVIVNSDDIRDIFLSELQRIREELNSLGMKDAAKTLQNLSGVARGRNDKILSDHLLTFQCEMDMLVQVVNMAYMPEAEEDGASKPLILTVDDEPAVLTATVEMLRDRYKVIAMTNAEDALKAMKKHSPALFLLDIEMPGTDGYELTKRIRRESKYHNTPILFLTSKGSKKYVMAAKEHGGNGYILKTTSRGDLLRIIGQHLDG